MSNGRSSPLPFAHVQLMRGEFQGSDQPFKDATDRYGRGKVDTHNLRKMYLAACETREVRENISPRNHLAITSLTDPPVPPPRRASDASQPLHRRAPRAGRG